MTADGEVVRHGFGDRRVLRMSPGQRRRRAQRAQLRAAERRQRASRPVLLGLYRPDTIDTAELAGAIMRALEDRGPGGADTSPRLRPVS